MTFIWLAIAVAYGFCMGFIYVCSHDPIGNTWADFFKRRLWFILGAPFLLLWLRFMYERDR